MSISRDMHDPAKNYVKTQYHVRRAVVDADENDRNDIYYESQRRIIKGLIGDHFIDNAFKITESPVPGDNFQIGSGWGYSNGNPAYIGENVDYDSNGDTPSKQNTHSRLTDVSFASGPNQTTFKDARMNWSTDELVGRQIKPNVLLPDAFTIVSNTETEIIVSGDHSNIGEVGDYYTVLLSPGTVRTDRVYLNYWLEEYTSADDPDLVHAIGSNSEAQTRIKGRCVIEVREDGGTMSSYIDSLGTTHFVRILAVINRLAATDILDAQIGDSRTWYSAGIIGAQVLGIKGAVDYYTLPGSPPPGATELPDPNTLQVGTIYIVRNDDGAPNGNGLYWVTEDSGPPVTNVWSFLDDMNLQDADEVSYDNTTSGLSAVNVQEALDEVDNTLDSLGTSYNSHDHSSGDPTQIAHSDTTGQGVNDHHDKQHGHDDGTHHSGLTTDNHHPKLHDLNSATEHNGISGAVEDNVCSFDASGYPKDSGQAITGLHPELHSIASHNDTSATGAELDTLTDASNADSLHTHAHTAVTGKTENDHHSRVHALDNALDHGAPSGWSDNFDRFRRPVYNSTGQLISPSESGFGGEREVFHGGHLSYGLPAGSWVNLANACKLGVSSGVLYHWEMKVGWMEKGSAGTRGVKVRFVYPTLPVGVLPIGSYNCFMSGTHWDSSGTAPIPGDWNISVIACTTAGVYYPVDGTSGVSVDVSNIVRSSDTLSTEIYFSWPNTLGDSDFAMLTMRGLYQNWNNDGYLYPEFNWTGYPVGDMSVRYLHMRMQQNGVYDGSSFGIYG